MPMKVNVFENASDTPIDSKPTSFEVIDGGSRELDFELARKRAIMLSFSIKLGSDVLIEVRDAEGRRLFSASAYRSVDHRSDFEKTRMRLLVLLKEVEHSDQHRRKAILNHCIIKKGHFDPLTEITNEEVAEALRVEGAVK